MSYKDREKQKSYARQWIQKRKEEWFAAHGPCVQCGSSEQLQVDHIDPTQKVSHRLWSWSQERREVELAKCQVLCERCHLKKTVAYRKALVQHGSGTMYKTYGCRCEPCKKAN